MIRLECKHLSGGSRFPVCYLCWVIVCGHGHNNSSLGPCCECLEYQASPPAHYSSQPHTFYIPPDHWLSTITAATMFSFTTLIISRPQSLSSKLLLVTAPPAAVGGGASVNTHEENKTGSFL